jgi:protein SCO1/2
MRRVRILLWLLVGAAVIGFGALLLLRNNAGVQAAVSGASFTVGGPFTLSGSDGQPFSSSALTGKPYAIFFGFTHCPDVCPTTLSRLVRLREQLGSGPGTPAILFVTVDPERDGPAEVGKYAQMFNAPIIGLTGSPAQIAQVKKQFRIFSQKVPDESGGYSVDHSAAALLFDAQGKFAGTIVSEEPDSAALDKMRRIAATG